MILHWILYGCRHISPFSGQRLSMSEVIDLVWALNRPAHSINPIVTILIHGGSLKMAAWRCHPGSYMGLRRKVANIGSTLSYEIGKLASMLCLPGTGTNGPRPNYGKIPQTIIPSPAN